MKKNLTLLTGIVLLITILIAGGCSSPQPQDRLVKISCKAVAADDGSLQFTMWDNDDALVATLSSKDSLKYDAHLITDVQPGGKVQWKWGTGSQVREFVKVAPQKANGKIMPGPAKPHDGQRVLKLEIPDDAPEGEESYYIQFIWAEDTVTIDPYLKVPPTQEGG